MHIQNEINLVVISASCSMFQNPIVLKIAKFGNFDTNDRISYKWGNCLVIVPLANNRILKIGHVIKFW